MSSEKVASLIRTDEGGVCTLRLARPDARNALNLSLLQSLKAELEAIAQSSKLRVLVITGEGDKAFCAGADLKERRSMDLEQTRTFVSLISAVFRQIEALEIPSIAVMNGVAFGGGLELALACDFRVAIKSAKMGLTECALGIIPGAGGTQRLPRLVGLSRAKELILSAQVIDAEEALSIGLVDAVANDASQLHREAQRRAEALLRCAPLSVKAAKQAIMQGLEQPLDKGLAIEHDAYERIIESEDRKEGLRAFAEKRTPQFMGR